MGVKKFAVKMLIKDKNQSLMFLLAMIISVVLVFNIFNIIYNENLIQLQNEYSGTINIIVVALLSISMFLTFFASSFFLMNKSKELGIALTSGLSTYSLASLLFYQTFILIIISLLIGLILGISTSPTVQEIIYKAANITSEPILISQYGLILTVMFMLILAVFLVLFNCGYAFRTEVIDIVTETKKVSNPDTRRIKIPKQSYIIVFLLPIILPIFNVRTADQAQLVFGFMIFVTYGTFGVIRYYIPYKIMELKKNKYFEDKIKLISLSNLYYALKKALPLVLMLAISSTLFITLIASNSDYELVKLICIFTYGLITILLGLSIIYKILIETYNKRKTFVQLRLMGYSKEQVIKIILQEIGMFNILTVGAPLFHIIILLITFTKTSLISLSLAGILLLIFVSVYMASFIISYLGYKKIVIDYLYGGQ